METSFALLAVLKTVCFKKLVKRMVSFPVQVKVANFYCGLLVSEGLSINFCVLL